MTFTIEPMITLGTDEWDMWDDGWTVVTQDRRGPRSSSTPSVVTADGAEILTLPEGAGSVARGMAKVYDGIDPAWPRGSGAQPVFFVATAPLAADGLVNLSPKGASGTFPVRRAHVRLLDITGSGIETVAHLRENGRVCVMFCSFDGAPNDRAPARHRLGRLGRRPLRGRAGRVR